MAERKTIHPEGKWVLKSQWAPGHVTWIQVGLRGARGAEVLNAPGERRQPQCL